MVRKSNADPASTIASFRQIANFTVFLFLKCVQNYPYCHVSTENAGDTQEASSPRNLAVSFLLPCKMMQAKAKTD